MWIETLGKEANRRQILELRSKVTIKSRSAVSLARQQHTGLASFPTHDVRYTTRTVRTTIVIDIIHHATGTKAKLAHHNVFVDIQNVRVNR